MGIFKLIRALFQREKISIEGYQFVLTVTKLLKFLQSTQLITTNKDNYKFKDWKAYHKSL